MKLLLVQGVQVANHKHHFIGTRFGDVKSVFHMKYFSDLVGGKVKTKENQIFYKQGEF